MLQIKVLVFLIDSDVWDGVCDETSYISAFLAKRSTWGPRGDNYASEPMLSTSWQFDDIRSVLVGEGIRFEIMDTSEDYDLYVTNAPHAFDYDTLIDVATQVGQHGKVERLVAIDRSMATFQIERNRSGLFQTRKV